MKNYTPDLKAPRFRKKVLGTLNKQYIDHLKLKVSAAKKLSNEQIKQIILTFNKNMYTETIEYRDGVEIPSQIGCVFIGTCQRPQKKNIDRALTQSLNTEIEYKNWETDNKLAKIFYTNHENRYSFANYELWGFTATRDFKRTVAHTYPKNWKKYIEVVPDFKISYLFRRNYKKILDAEKALNIEDYNELEID